MRAAIWWAAVLVVFVSTGALAQTAPAWEVARAAILKDYAKQQPGDKVLEVTGPEKREAIIIAIRYYGSALVQRADGSRSRDRVLVEYRLVGSAWELERVHVYESQALAEMPAPSAAQAHKLFAAAWPKDKCEGYDIQDVKIDGEPRFQLETVADRAKAKRWYVYTLNISAKGNGKFRMSEDGAAYLNRTQNLLLWDPAGKSWSVDPRQLRCSFTKQK